MTNYLSMNGYNNSIGGFNNAIMNDPYFLMALQTPNPLANYQQTQQMQQQYPQNQAMQQSVFSQTQASQTQQVQQSPQVQQYQQYAQSSPALNPANNPTFNGKDTKSEKESSSSLWKWGLGIAVSAAAMYGLYRYGKAGDVNKGVIDSIKDGGEKVWNNCVNFFKSKPAEVPTVEIP